ncbi:MAG: glycosyl transferase [Rhodobacteraceae bacterium]|nr:MAG: glycosyl transferase [Paracoccaceae bacterium]
MRSMSIIVPAHNEAALIGDCLRVLLASDCMGPVEVLVIANGCTDQTGTIAQGFAPEARARGWSLRVIEVIEGGKLNALNVGDAAATGAIRVYLDADVMVGAELIRQLGEALGTDAPRYASGRPVIAPANSRFTRAYARFWQILPFVQGGVPGFGVFAMNAAGRSRWGAWPDIISDDTYARLNFAASERVGVDAPYTWPMVEGVANLVRVRRRQNMGVIEIASLFPVLLANDDKSRLSVLGLLRRALGDPMGFAAYVAVALTVKSPFLQSRDHWARGR